MSSFVVGLTGGIGSGKTTVANLFAELNVEVIDADQIARDVVKPNSHGLSAIIKKFGPAICLQSGELNRAQLRKIVFANKADKAWLDNLLHPLIRSKMQLAVKEAKSDYCLLVVPLLIENNLQYLSNRILVIDVDKDTQIQRTAARDGSDIKTIKSIIASQVSRNERLSYADDVINNVAINKDDLKIQVAKLHRLYIGLANNNNNR